MGLIRYLDTVLSLPLEAEFLVFPDDSCVGGVTGKLSCAVKISETVGVVTVKSLLCVMEMLSDFCCGSTIARGVSGATEENISVKHRSLSGGSASG